MLACDAIVAIKVRRKELNNFQAIVISFTNVTSKIQAKLARIKVHEQKQQLA